MDLPDGPFDLVYADPPWRYEVTGVRGDPNGHYPTMSLEDIAALPVAGLVADDSVLLLWSTSPLLVEALQVMDAWGFTYRTQMVWCKDRMGVGYVFRGQHETLLYGIRGRPAAPPPAARHPSVLHAPRTRHSAKPEHVRYMIESMYPGARCVELFARRACRGWVAWGNEAPAEPDLTLF